jgi:hypothetical protein
VGVAPASPWCTGEVSGYRVASESSESIVRPEATAEDKFNHSQNDLERGGEGCDMTCD